MLGLIAHTLALDADAKQESSSPDKLSEVSELSGASGSMVIAALARLEGKVNAKFSKFDRKLTAKDGGGRTPSSQGVGRS